MTKEKGELGGGEKVPTREYVVNDVVFPRWWWEKGVALCFMRRQARWREQSSWKGISWWLKLERCNHPTVDELLLVPNRHARGWMLPSSASNHMVIIIAVYSSTLFMWGVRMLGRV